MRNSKLLTILNSLLPPPNKQQGKQKVKRFETNTEKQIK